MKSVLRLVAVFLFALGAQLALAHSGEQHEGRGEATPALAEEAQASPAQQESTVSASTSEEAADEHEGSSVWTQLHPATVHFPIALLLAAALTELVHLVRPNATLANAVRVMAIGGAAGAIIAALFGWIHTGLWYGGDAVMQWHRWTGSALALVAPLAAWLAGRDNRTPLRILLFAIACALVVQGYLGGELAHGPHHLGF